MARDPTRILLKIANPRAESAVALARAIGAMSGACGQDGWIELTYDDLGDPLRSVNRACRIERVTATLLAEAAVPAAPDAPYERFWDRTEDLAAKLNAWRDGQMPFPELKARELIRLPI